MSIRTRNWTTGKGEPRRAYVLDYVAQDGRRHIETFARRRDAEARESEVKEAVKAGTHTPSSNKATLGDACAAWLERCTAEGLERSTLAQYRQHAEHHIKDLLDPDLKLARLTAAMVEEFRDQLLNTGRSRALSRKILTSLKGALKAAVRRGMVAQNVAQNVAIAANGRHKRRLEVGIDIPTVLEVRAILAAADESDKRDTRPLLDVLVHVGLRASELRGLRWADIDLDARRLHVKQRADKWNAIGSPKSSSSYRSIPLPPQMVSRLREWRLASPPNELDLAFPNSAGRVQSLANLMNRRLAPLQVAAGVVDQDGEAKYGVHAFRHFNASWLIAQGENIRTVSARLGHSSPVITLTVYAHLMPPEDERERVAASELALVG